MAAPAEATAKIEMKAEAEFGGKLYGLNHRGEVFVWRLTSARTGRHTWVVVRMPSQALMARLSAA